MMIIITIILSLLVLGGSDERWKLHGAWTGSGRMSQRRGWDRAQARGTAPMISSSSTLSAPPSLEQRRYVPGTAYHAAVMWTHILIFCNINTTLLPSLAVLHAPSEPCSTYSRAGCEASIRHYRAPFDGRTARTAEMCNCFSFCPVPLKINCAAFFRFVSCHARSHAVYTQDAHMGRRTHSTAPKAQYASSCPYVYALLACVIRMTPGIFVC